MKKWIIFLWISSISILVNAGGNSPLSPVDLCVSPKHNSLIVAQLTGKRLDIIDLDTRIVRTGIGLPEEPKGLAYDGEDRIYAACSHSRGLVCIIDLVREKMVGSIEVGEGACSMVLSPDKTTLYVANQFSGDVSVVDLSRGKETGRIRVLRQPRALDISPDGCHLYVANFLPATRADLDVVASEVSVIDLKTGKTIAQVPLANGSNALHDIKVSPGGKYVLVSHNLGRYQIPTSQLEQGWMNTAALSIIRAGDHKFMATVLLDDAEHGAANPWGMAMDEEKLFVAHAGTHEVSAIDYPEFINRLENTASKEELSYRLGFLNGIRHRIPVNGQGPRAISLHGGRLYAALYFSDAVQEIDVEGEFDDISGSPGDLISMNPGMLMDSVRLGEMIFHDAQHCFQQWQSCASCHPDHARVDGLNWDLLNDGIGNPRNCKSLLLSHRTPPAMITGVRASAEVAVRAGFRHIQFTQVDEGTARAVDRYLQALEPVASPHLKKGKLSREAREGKKVYDRLGCAQCHPAPLFTDMQSYAMGEKNDADPENGWDTPTLVEIWRTAPYLHDGRCRTLHEVFDAEMHGLEEPLDPKDTDLLVRYLLSL